jgi:hypothetical protein
MKQKPHLSEKGNENDTSVSDAELPRQANVEELSPTATPDETPLTAAQIVIPVPDPPSWVGRCHDVFDLALLVTIAVHRAWLFFRGA